MNFTTITKRETFAHKSCVRKYAQQLVHNVEKQGTAVIIKVWINRPIHTMKYSKRKCATATHNSVNEATNIPSERSLTQKGSYCNLWLTNGCLGDCERQWFTGGRGCFWGDLMFCIWIGIGLHRYLHLRISEMVHLIYIHLTVSKLYLKIRSKRSGPVVKPLAQGGAMKECMAVSKWTGWRANSGMDKRES